MATYSLSGGMKRIDVSANDIKNRLPIGTVLHLNGYNNPDYVIVKNFGVNPGFESHGATYQTVSIETGRFERKNMLGVDHISTKSQNLGIHMFWTDEIKTPDEVLELYQKAESLESLEKTTKGNADRVRAELVAKGKSIAQTKGIDTAVALIVAEYEKDQSDTMTDYFATSTTQLVILATSMHGRDMFSEMRKAAIRFNKTKHLGPNKGVFSCRVVFENEVKCNGCGHWKGDHSPWHNDIEKEFTTRTEAEAYINNSPAPCSIGVDGQTARFIWRLDEHEIEHREKYSMGAGYYLKSSSRYSSAWKVRKIKKWGDKWDDSVYVSLAQVCII